MVAKKFAVAGQEPLKLDGLALAVTPVTVNEGFVNTKIVVDLLDAPVALTAVSVKLVVVVGMTVVVPEAATVPTPWSIVIEVAFDTFQVKVEEAPVSIPEGVAVK